MSGRRPGQQETIALFPLATVLMPGQLLPLHIFEDRYRRLLADLQQRPEPDRFFGVVAIREGFEVGADSVKGLYDVGTSALLRHVSPTPEGGSSVVTSGVQRFRIIQPVLGQSYPQAQVEWLDEGAEISHTALAPTVDAQFQLYRAAVASVGAIEAAQMTVMPAAPLALSYLVAAAMVLDIADRQRLLEEPEVTGRLRYELTLLHRENILLRELPSLPAVQLAATPVALN